MAEEVKNNARIRRLPVHLRQDYDDNFEPQDMKKTKTNNNRKKSCDQPNFQQMAMLLVKFINTANQKKKEHKPKKIKKRELPTEKVRIPESQNALSSNSRAQKLKTSSRSQIGIEESIIIDEKTSKKMEAVRKKQNSQILIEPIAPNRKKAQAIKLPSQTVEKNNSRVSTRSRIFQQEPLRIETEKQKQNVRKNSQNNRKVQSEAKPELKKETKKENKIFKRATFHLAIAYFIHYQNAEAKKQEPLQKSLDPISHSRFIRNKFEERLKQQKDRLRIQALSQSVQHRENSGFCYCRNCWEATMLQRSLAVQNQVVQQFLNRQTGRKPPIINIADSRPNSSNQKKESEEIVNKKQSEENPLNKKN